jgi:hypothetical protein
LRNRHASFCLPLSRQRCFRRRVNSQSSKDRLVPAEPTDTVIHNGYLAHSESFITTWAAIGRVLALTSRCEGHRAEMSFAEPLESREEDEKR